MCVAFLQGDQELNWSSFLLNGEANKSMSGGTTAYSITFLKSNVARLHSVCTERPLNFRLTESEMLSAERT